MNRGCWLCIGRERFFVIRGRANRPRHYDRAVVDVLNAPLVEVTPIGEVELMAVMPAAPAVLTRGRADMEQAVLAMPEVATVARLVG